MNEDPELLHRFVAQNSQVAFQELVQRRIDFVYAAALRQVGGEAHLAQEVVQNVFLDLARKARVLANRPTLLGWLYTSTRFAAGKALRSRTRRIHHETEAHAMQEILAASSATDLNWSELRPVLDAAMHELNEKDREAILLRYFEDLSLAEVGASLGLGENSARMRVERALEKLRGRLARRGITSTAAALGAALAGQPATAAPAGLAVTVTTFSVAGATALGGGIATALWVLKLMNMTKLTIGIVGTLAGLGLGAFLGIRYQDKEVPAAATSQVDPQSSTAALQEENRRLGAEVAALKSERLHSAAAAEEASASARATPAPGALDQLWVLVELQKKKLVNSQMTFVDPNRKLNPAFTELFALTPGEQQSLQLVVDKASAQLAEMEKANTTVARTNQNEVVMTVKSFAAQGGAAYDELLKSFAGILGPERNAAYLALGAEQVESALDGFGAPERVVTVVYNPTNPKRPYTVKENLKLPQRTSSNAGDFDSFRNMTNRVGSLSELLPADFGEKK